MSIATKDPNGVYEVGIEVRHLCLGNHGTVTEVLEGKRVKAHFPARGLDVELPGLKLETLLAQARRHAERHRRRGGSVAPEQVEDRTIWSNEELVYLEKAAEAYVPIQIQAAELQRTEEAVVSQRVKRGLAAEYPQDTTGAGKPR